MTITVTTSSPPSPLRWIPPRPERYIDPLGHSAAAKRATLPGAGGRFVRRAPCKDGGGRSRVRAGASRRASLFAPQKEHKTLRQAEFCLKDVSEPPQKPRFARERWFGSCHRASDGDTFNTYPSKQRWNKRGFGEVRHLHTCKRVLKVCFFKWKNWQRCQQQPIRLLWPHTRGCNMLMTKQGDLSHGSNQLCLNSF